MPFQSKFFSALTSRNLLVAACLLAVIILAAAFAIRQYRTPKLPVLTPVVFQPLTGIQAEQTRAAFQAHTNNYFTTEEAAALTSSTLTWAPIKTGDLKQQGAYFSRAESPKICTNTGACPTAIVKPRGATDSPESQILYLTEANNVTTTNQGDPQHPDLLLNAGVPDAYLVRLKWEQLDDGNPGYIPYVEQRNAATQAR